jgi:hypothetical protein
MQLEVARATLDCARSDMADETDRARALDGKLTNIASFSAIALSISGAVGASVVVSGKLSPGFTIALGSVLGAAVLLLLAGALVALSGLSPKNYRGLALPAARDRVTPARLSDEPAKAIGILAATYYTGMLPEARETNQAKVRTIRRAFWLVGSGLGGLAVGLILSTVAAVV